MDSRSERLKDFFGKLRPGFILAAAIVVGFIIGEIANFIPLCSLGSPCPSALELLVQYNELVVYYHAYWQLFTSILVTNSYGDAAFNAIAVLVIDYFLPEPFNNTRYFAIFFGAALFGNVLTLAAGPNYASAGASGGIFGVFAAAFAYNWAEEKKIDNTTLALFLIVFVSSSFLFPGVNWVAHVGGSLAGFIGGPVLYLSLKDKTSDYSEISKSSTRNRFILWLVILFLVAASIAQFLLAVLG